MYLSVTRGRARSIHATGRVGLALSAKFLNHCFNDSVLRFSSSEYDSGPGTGQGQQKRWTQTQETGGGRRHWGVGLRTPRSKWLSGYLLWVIFKNAAARPTI